MLRVLAPLALIYTQSTYGPPPPPPPAAAPAQAPVGDSTSTLDTVLRAQGMSEDGLRAMRGVPQPTIARGATRAAQCAVEKLRTRDPLPVGELVGAMQERDATAAAQAQARTSYLASVLPRLRPADQMVLLAVLGDGAAIGGDAPPRPQPRGAGGGDRLRGPGAGGRGADQGPPSGGRPGERTAGGMGRGATRGAAGPAAPQPPPRSAEASCARYLGD